MAKLPKSSRPDRRKPSDTFNHPYQLNCFAPPLASSLREVGWVARSLTGIFLALIGGYLTGAHSLPDGSLIKADFLSRAMYLASALATVLVIEVLRTLKAFDYPKLGKLPKWALISINLAAVAFVAWNVVDLPASTSSAHYERAQAKLRAEERGRRKEDDRLAECNAQKTKEIDGLVKRRQAAFAEHKRCLSDWVKPGLFSKETPEESCAPKWKEYQQASANVKVRETRTCAMSN
jgi:hypothetical protein